jgi:hypothetical protein
MTRRLREMKKSPKEKQVRFLTIFLDGIMLIEGEYNIIK